MSLFGWVSEQLGAKNKYKANEGAYQPQTNEAATNNLKLQQLLQDQIASGTNPAARFAADQGMAQNASLLGSMHGISPAAFVSALGQANARTQGQAAGIGASQQLGQEQLLGGLAGQMFGQGLGYQMNAQGINAGVAGQNAKTNAAIAGGVLNSLGGGAAMSGGGGGGGGMMGGGGGGGAGVMDAGGGAGAAGAAGAWSGGTIRRADGGDVDDPNRDQGPQVNAPQVPSPSATAPRSRPQPAGQGQFGKPNTSGPAGMDDSGFAIGKGSGDIIKNLVEMMMAQGGQIDYRDQGGHVPGQAPMAGDHPQNDVVPAKLSPGEIVIPRSVAQSPDAPDRAAAFVEAIKASGGKGKPKGGDFAGLLAKHRELEGRLKRLEHLAEGGEVEGDEGTSDTWEAIKATLTGDKDAPEKINRALPDWLGGHSAVAKQRSRLAKMDAQTKE